MNKSFEFMKNQADLHKTFHADDPKDQEKMKQMFSGMSQKDQQKVLEVLGDPEKTRQLMQSPAAQQLMKMLGGKNG